MTAATSPSCGPLPPLGDSKRTSVAIVGCGVVGRGWIPVFARAGCNVRVYDPKPGSLDAAKAWITANAGRPGITGENASGAVSVHESLTDAVSGAGYIQESLPEDLQAKRAMFVQLDSLAAADAYLGSSTSSLDINDIARDVTNSRRCFTVHPFNPASVIPVVEVLGTVSSTETDLRTVVDFLRYLRQKPVVLRRFIPGYIGNRLQAAVMREALHLVVDGITDANGIDSLISHALALRWVGLGLFGTNHTNDDDGLRGYYAKFWPSYQALMATLASGAPDLDPAVIDRIGDAVERRFGNANVADIGARRDELVRQVRRIQDGAENRAAGVSRVREVDPPSRRG